jgi:hypothetical protein
MSLSKKACAGIIALVALAAAQLVRFPRTNPSIDPARTIEARTQLAPQVAGILERACADCHTHKTRWPWYSNIAPVSWLVVHDVAEGREVLNLSEWAAFSPGKADGKLNAICQEVSEGDMPPWYYLPLHPAAKLSAEDKQAVCAWTQAERQRIKSIQQAP